MNDANGRVGKTTPSAANGHRPIAKCSRYDGKSISLVSAVLTYEVDGPAGHVTTVINYKRMTTVRYAVVEDINNYDVARPQVGDGSIRLLSQSRWRVVIERWSRTSQPCLVDPTIGDVEAIDELDTLPLVPRGNSVDSRTG